MKLLYPENGAIMKLILTLLLISITFHINAKPKEYGNIIVSEITSIYDADTFRVNIKGFPPIVGQHMPIRVLGIDAPEIRGKCKNEKELARKAKKVTVEILRNAKIIELHNMKRGKYFRILAQVIVDGKNLGQLLIKSGHARSYSGGARLGWCN